MAKIILIVEDEASLMTALRDKLMREGFQVLEGHNGEEGLAAALAHHPDLILLDVVMPRMDGIELLKKLRQDPWGKSALVILLTNLSDTKTIAESLENKVTDYLVKADWDMDEVMAKIKQKLSLGQ